VSINPTFSSETITPSIAEQYLSKNTRNRNKKPQAIQRYARDMAAGRWQMTGEAIKFDTNGDLCDGQNRLYAVVESGATVQMAVIRELAPESMSVMDIVVPRSGADSLKLAGYTNATSLQAAINAHSAYHGGRFKHCMTAPDSSERLTNAEIVSYIEQHPHLVDLTTVCNTIRKRLPLPIGSLVTAYDTFLRIDVNATDDFFTRIQDMVSSGKGDPIGTLIQKGMMERGGRTRTEVSTGLYYLFRAWNAYRDNTQLTAFRLGSRGGWFPIPEPH